MYFIKEILTSQTFPVRHSVLRKGMPIATCSFENDDLSTTFHYGCFKNETLVGVASLYQKTNPKFKTTTQFQLRGMAVLDEFQKQGIGEQLLLFIENQVKELHAEAIIWCHARGSAVGFYKKLNYSTIGNILVIKDIGNHYIMYKKVSRP